MRLLKKYPYKHYNRFSDTEGRKYLVDNIKVNLKINKISSESQQGMSIGI